MLMTGITAEGIWQLHRAALGGTSAISGAALPVRLEDCPAGVQAAHWGIALGICQVLALPDPPLPASVTLVDAEHIRARLVPCLKA